MSLETFSNFRNLNQNSYLYNLHFENSKMTINLLCKVSLAELYFGLSLLFPYFLFYGESFHWCSLLPFIDTPYNRLRYTRCRRLWFCITAPTSITPPPPLPPPSPSLPLPNFAGDKGANPFRAVCLVRAMPIPRPSSTKSNCRMNK